MSAGRVQVKGGGRTRGSERAVAAADPVVPKLDARWFRHELTPTWLAVAAMVSGHRPIDLDGPLRIAWVGSEAHLTPAVVAAVHPSAEVLAWDPDPEKVAAIGRIASRADLPNLVVHEEPAPPQGGPERFDIVVLDGSFDAYDEDLRRAAADAVGRLLRPGGMAVVSYRTVIGWGEITPVLNLLRHLVVPDRREPVSAVSDAKVLLELLDERGARYFAGRPVVRAWLKELLDLSPAEIRDLYLRRPIVPVSHAQVCGLLTEIGASYLGDGTAGGDLLDDLPADLVRQVERTEPALLRRTFADLAARRDRRVDVFGLGCASVPAASTSRTLRHLQLVATASGDHPRPARRLLGTRALANLQEGPMAVKDIWPDLSAAERTLALRRALAAGVVHPVVSEPSDDAYAAAQRLSRFLTSSEIPVPHRHLVAPAAGTAMPAERVAAPAHRKALGMEGR